MFGTEDSRHPWEGPGITETEWAGSGKEIVAPPYNLSISMPVAKS